MSLRNTVITMLPLYLFLFCTCAAPIAAAAITWRADVGGAVYSTPVFSASGELYVSSYDGNLYSIAANGSRTWRVFLGPLYYSPLFVQDSRISDAMHSARGSNGSVSLERSGSDFPKVFAGYNIGGGGLGVVAGISSVGQLLFRDTFGVGSLQCAPQYLRGTLLSCDDGGFIVALDGDGRGQLWSADIHGGSVLSNIVVFDNVLDGILCVGGAAHRIVCLDVNGTAIWNTTGGGSSGDFVTVLSSARGGGSLVSGAFCLCVRALPNLLALSSCSGATQQLLPSRVVILIHLAASFLGHVTSHSSSNGDVQWSFNAGSSVTCTATLPTSSGRIDALVVATAAGSVLALSCADGVLLWSAGFKGPVAVAAGQNPVVPQQRSFLVFFLSLCFALQLSIACLCLTALANACTRCNRTTVRNNCNARACVFVEIFIRNHHLERRCSSTHRAVLSSCRCAFLLARHQRMLGQRRWLRLLHLNERLFSTARLRTPPRANFLLLLTNAITFKSEGSFRDMSP